jgi:preprotein translocase subunit SecA
VMNDQRKTIFEQRLEFIGADSVHDVVVGMRHQLIEDLVKRYVPAHTYAEQWRTTDLQTDVKEYYGIDLPIVAWGKEDGIAEEELIQRIVKAADERGEERMRGAPPDVVSQIERAVLLQTMDHEWREHLITLDHLRHTIGLRGYGQRDPLNEYKSEAFLLFEGLLARVRQQITRQMMHVQLQLEAPPDLEERALPPMRGVLVIVRGPSGRSSNSFSPVSGLMCVARIGGRPVPVDPNDPNTWGKVQRNSPCPCGSGKKFKQCHGVI